MNSCLYECVVMHQRLAPRRHGFRYRLFLLALDLDEIDLVSRRLVCFRRNRFHLFSFHDRDHLTGAGAEGRDIKAVLTAWVRAQGAEVPPGGRILLLSFPRILNYVFNPASFYFCCDASGAPAWAVVEVENTFRERKPYFIPYAAAEGRFRARLPKDFYVSPFSPLDLTFDFNLSLPGGRLALRIDDRQDGERVLISSLAGRRTTLTSARLAWFLVKYPLLTVRVMALIHWHALRLWAKGVPWHRKNADPARQRGIVHHPAR